MPLDTTAFVAVVGIFTVIIQQAFAMWQASRNRQWDLEDRETKAAEVRAHLEEQARGLKHDVQWTAFEVKEQLAQHNSTVQREAEVRTNKLITAVDKNTLVTQREAKVTQEMLKENTQISEKAFEEANSVNTKIANLGLLVADGIDKVTPIEQHKSK